MEFPEPVKLLHMGVHCGGGEFGRQLHTTRQPWVYQTNEDTGQGAAGRSEGEKELDGSTFFSWVASLEEAPPVSGWDCTLSSPVPSPEISKEGREVEDAENKRSCTPNPLGEEG